MVKIISIDTSDSKKISVELDSNGKKLKTISGSTILKSEATLPLIDEILCEEKILAKDIDGINVSIQNGSFTGLRVGAAIANAFGFLLRIPVNGKEIGEFAYPVYNK